MMSSEKLKDFVGKELKVGDEVIYLSHNRTSSELHRGNVIDFTLKKVRLDTYLEDGHRAWRELKYPHHLVKMRWSEVTND